MINKDNFLGKDWLLDTTEGIKLYHDVAVPLRKEVGIIDTHTHHNLYRDFFNIRNIFVGYLSKEYRAVISICTKYNKNSNRLKKFDIFLEWL